MIHHTAAPSRLHLLVGACLALCGGIAQAAEPTQADLNSILLYGSTTIAQDSTDSWGVWDQLEPTAAGPALPKLSIPGLTEWYRSLSQVAANAPVAPVAPVAPAEVLATQICAGGSICGFGRAANSSLVFIEGPSDKALPSAQYAYSVVATATTLPVITRETAAALAESVTPSFTWPAAITVTSQVLGEGGPLLSPESGVLTFSGKGYSGGSDGARYSIVAATMGNNTYFDNRTVQAAWFDNPISRYVAGQGDTPGSIQFQNSVGVAGVTTSNADMSSLRTSNATATYTGYDKNGLDAKIKPNVTLTVNFGNSTFTGSVNGGADRGTVQTQTTTRGTQLAGLVGVNIDKGVITGANFMSTALSATDGKIGAGSVVQGAFFGPNAAAAGGVVSITKTSNSGTYTNATHVTPFLTIRDDLLNKKQ
jgi:hypothetical protein